MRALAYVMLITCMLLAPGFANAALVTQSVYGTPSDIWWPSNSDRLADFVGDQPDMGVGSVHLFDVTFDNEATVAHFFDESGVESSEILLDTFMHTEADELYSDATFTFSPYATSVFHWMGLTDTELGMPWYRNVAGAGDIEDGGFMRYSTSFWSPVSVGISIKLPLDSYQIGGSIARVWWGDPYMVDGELNILDVSQFVFRDVYIASEVPAAVPVPAAGLLFGSFLVGLAGLKRIRKKK